MREADTARAMPYRLKPGALTSHGRILAALKGVDRSARILDVGTASGYLGAALQQLGFRHVAGLEANPDWAQQARGFYESFAVGNIERDTLPWPERSFDAVICADVLEHVREPEAVLQQLSRLLAPGGLLLISLPNVAHWSMRASLFFGRFEYVASGLMDRSHVRFFTRASARRLLCHAGLRLIREEATPLPFAHWCNGSPLTPLWRCLERIDWLCGRLRPTLFAYQFLFTARTPGANEHD